MVAGSADKSGCLQLQFVDWSFTSVVDEQLGQIRADERKAPASSPVELPVEQAKYDWVINVRAARALRLPIPPTLQARVDQVIEQWTTAARTPVVGEPADQAGRLLH
jgi:hypothetical protein